MLATDMWNEPDWGAEDKIHDKPIMFASNLTVTGLTKGNKYTCLRFDNPNSVPSSMYFAINPGTSDLNETLICVCVCVCVRAI